MRIVNFLLEANAEGLKELPTVSDKLSTGLTVMALGLATVFAVLAILWVVLLLFRVIFYHEKKAEPKAPQMPLQVPVTVPAKEEQAPAAPEEDNGTLIAAITAAIAAYTEGDEEFASGFRVVSFRRAEHASPWNKSK